MQFKNLYIVHYHLHTGGVSSVIEKGLHAILRSHCLDLQSIQVLSGTKRSSIKHDFKTKNCSVKNIYVPMFAYQEHCEKLKKYNKYSKMKERTEQIRKDIAAFFETHHNKQNLWWIHNYHLGKNPLFTKELLRFIQKKNPYIILQIHDFPEQARYSQLKTLHRVVGKDLYKFNTHTRLAVINDYDKDVLKKSGLKAFIIPNIVRLAQIKKTTKTDTSFKTYLHKNQKILNLKNTNFLLFSYPVRCIRRKNVVESMLYTKLFESFSHIPSVLNVTLPGLSQSEKIYTARAKALARKGFSRTVFSLGADPSCPFTFEAMCHASDLIISSSVLEGFGYTYLESLIFNKALLARSINQNKRIRSMLKLHWPSVWYNTLAIPKCIIEDLHHTFSMPSLSSLYKKKIVAIRSFLDKEDQKKIQSTMELRLNQGSVDFSLLSLHMQECIMKNYTEYEEVLLKENKKIIQQIYYILVSQKNSFAQRLLRGNLELNLPSDSKRSYEGPKSIYKLVEKAYGEEAFLRVLKTIFNDFARKQNMSDQISLESSRSIIRLHCNLENVRPLYDTL